MQQDSKNDDLLFFGEANYWEVTTDPRVSLALTDQTNEFVKILIVVS
jgi:hypothetical protein